MTSSRAHYVVVPHRVGPLLDLDADGGERRDELDELIDDLFPDVDEGPGPFDVGLVAVGLGLLGWGVLAEGPGWAVVVGLLAVGLGCVLPIRSGWRALRNRSSGRRRAAVLGDGALLDTSAPPVAAIVRSYESLFTIDPPTGRAVDPELLGRVRAAGHAAVSEVASLLAGRPPTTERERVYVQDRADAVSALVEETMRAAARAVESTSSTHPDPDALVAAREELDQLAPFTTVSRIEDLTDELRRTNGSNGV